MASAKVCLVCGIRVFNSMVSYYDFGSVKSCYRSGGFIDVCDSCGAKANSYVDYHGKKSKKDIANLESFLLTGVMPMRKYNALMFGGYTN